MKWKVLSKNNLLTWFSVSWHWRGLIWLLHLYPWERISFMFNSITLRRNLCHSYFCIFVKGLCHSVKGPLSLLVQWPCKGFSNLEMRLQVFLPQILAQGPPSATLPSVTMSPLLIVRSCPPCSDYFSEFYITIHFLTLTQFHTVDKGNKFLCNFGIDMHIRV